MSDGTAATVAKFTSCVGASNGSTSSPFDKPKSFWTSASQRFVAAAVYLDSLISYRFHT